eukprot:9260846-Lingulodinium_polyedra.AAC.1
MGVPSPAVAVFQQARTREARAPFRPTLAARSQFPRFLEASASIEVRFAGFGGRRGFARGASENVIR